MARSYVLPLLLASSLVGCPTEDETLPSGPDWSAEATLPEGGDRANIYELPDDELAALRADGARYATAWPVDVSGVLVPYQPLRRILDEDSPDPVIQNGRELGRAFLGFDSMDALYDWVGAPVANEPGMPHPYETPLLPGDPSDRLGVSVIDTPDGEALTFSCAACHAGRLLGRTVLGLANRRSRANSFFEFGREVVGFADPDVLRNLGDATDGEVALLERTAQRMGAIGTREPQSMGLDTSLAQVALSLARRAEDPWATRDFVSAGSPRPNALETDVADSKPMPWWTLKYKTRWLSDGSIVSGNPVHTNFLWNELGRGTDLPELDAWLAENDHAVRALTAAVFASEPPRWADFFGPETLDRQLMEEGHAEFEERCSSCHGSYAQVGDDAAGFPLWSLSYASRTQVVDVGTSSGRAEGMNAFAADLNRLAISAELGTVVEPQEGYIPPPLDGVWARYPYLHNGSVPSLCALLTPPEERPQTFVQGPSETLADFDAECVGYPVGEEIPSAWDVEDSYDTTREGMSNAGHDEMLVGVGPAERAALVEFLKTL